MDVLLREHKVFVDTVKLITNIKIFHITKGLLKNFSRKIETNAVRRFDGTTYCHHYQGKVTVSSWFEYK